MWDSTGPRGGSGIKFARSIVSEIIGVNAVPGKSTRSRIDPLGFRAVSGVLYAGKDGKPSEANHGNVTPTVLDAGFTIEYAEQSTVLSLPALRRLRFPSAPGEKSSPAADAAARTYLASLGLLAATLVIESGYDLRSRCVLRATEAVTWHLLGKPGEADVPFTLDRTSAVRLYEESLAALQKAKLPIHLDEVALTPTPDLITLVKKSMEIAAFTGSEEAK
jgi:CRISPR-associated protein Csb1